MGSMNGFPGGLSRRLFARLVAGAALSRACAGTESNQPGGLAWNADTARGFSLERRYRADAHVLLFGVPVLRRQNVGGGSVLWRESEAAGSARLLEFSGFSLPERAAGLNRLGFIRETVQRPGKDGSECTYFGLMTASPEESAEEARKALHSNAKELAYSAIEGRIAPGGIETAIAHFMAPAAVTGENRGELVERARRALASAEEVRTAGDTREPPRSFLQELARLLMLHDGSEGRYIYSGRPYRIYLARSQDGKATAYFRERRLIAGPAEAVRVAGRVRREAGGRETEFRLWIPGGGERPLPLRIEYQAKPYLRLVFEAAAGSDG